MKNTDGGQLYTIEGFAAALIMLITAYLVVNATSIYTAGDTHISDMQLEALGTDALKMMGTPMNSTESVNGNSTLRTIIETSDSDTFREQFLELVNITGTGSRQDIQFTASYTCRNTSPAANNAMETIPISYSRNITGGEHTVRATKWMIMDETTVPPICGSPSESYRAVLVEVLLWRD